MIERRHYMRCSLFGKGDLGIGKMKLNFDIINMSATGAKIKVPTSLEKDQVLDLQMHFNGHIVNTSMSVKARVLRGEFINGELHYGIEFLNLNQSDRVELDELIALSCNTNSIGKGLYSCEEGHCHFMSR